MALPAAGTIQNLTRCKTMPGFLPGGFCDQIIRRIAFEDVTGYGQTVQVNRATLGVAANYAADGPLGLLASSTTLAPFTFQRIGDTVEVDSADISSSEEGQQQLELQVQMKKVALIRQLGNQLIQGSGVPPNFTGLASGVDAGQTIDPAAGAPGVPTLSDYHRLVARVCASNGSVGDGPDALVMHPRTRRQLISLLETAAGGGAQYCKDETLGYPTLTFEGLPVYVSDNVSVVETAAGAQSGGLNTSAFALKLNGSTAVRILHQGGDTADFGMVTEEVPAQLGVSKRAVTVRGYYAVLIPEIKSLARLKALDISAFPE